jgi:hypothetical protein
MPSAALATVLNRRAAHPPAARRSILPAQAIRVAATCTVALPSQARPRHARAPGEVDIADRGLISLARGPGGPAAAGRQQVPCSGPFRQRCLKEPVQDVVAGLVAAVDRVEDRGRDVRGGAGAGSAELAGSGQGGPPGIWSRVRASMNALHWRPSRSRSTCEARRRNPQGCHAPGGQVPSSRRPGRPWPVPATARGARRLAAGFAEDLADLLVGAGRRPDLRRFSCPGVAQGKAADLVLGGHVQVDQRGQGAPCGGQRPTVTRIAAQPGPVTQFRLATT